MSDSPIKPNAHDLAQQYDLEIKNIVAKKYNCSVQELLLLTDSPLGAYFSEKEHDIFCCLVIGQKTERLYLITAEVDKQNKTLKNFLCEVVS